MFALANELTRCGGFAGFQGIMYTTAACQQLLVDGPGCVETESRCPQGFGALVVPKVEAAALRLG